MRGATPARVHSTKPPSGQRVARLPRQGGTSRFGARPGREYFWTRSARRPRPVMSFKRSTEADILPPRKNVDVSAG